MFKDQLKKIRKDKGITQTELSSMLNLTQGAYGFYEQGKREPNIDTLIKLSTILNVSTDLLLENHNFSEVYYKELNEIKNAMEQADANTRKRMLEMLKLAFPQAFDEYEWALNVLKEQNIQVYSMLQEGKTELSKNDIINMAKAIEGGK